VRPPLRQPNRHPPAQPNSQPEGGGTRIELSLPASVEEVIP